MHRIALARRNFLSCACYLVTLGLVLLRILKISLLLKGWFQVGRELKTALPHVLVVIAFVMLHMLSRISYPNLIVFGRAPSI